MRAARYIDGDVQILDVPTPDPGPDEALVRIDAAGLCHSDLHLGRGEWAALGAIPLIGHEAIGVVESLGPGADRYVGTGDRVILGLGGAVGYWCGACEHCLRGAPRLCAQGKPLIGTFAEYIAVWAPALVRVPDVVRDLDAPLACGGLTAYAAVKKLVQHGVMPGRSIAVVGAAGGLGHYGVQLATAFGYDVIGIDVGAERLEFASSQGARLTVDASEAAAVVRKELGGVDAALVFSARIGGYQLALELLRPSGLFVGVGIPPSDDGPMQIDPFQFMSRDPTLVFSTVGTVHDMRELVDLVAAGRVTTHVSRHGPLSELGSMFEDLAAGRYLGRAVVDDLAH